MKSENRSLLVGCVFVLVVAVALYEYITYHMDDSNKNSQGGQHLYHPSDISFEEIDNKFSCKSSLADSEKKEVWKRYEGECVEWWGEFTHVELGYLDGIRIGMRHKASTSTYDVQISVSAEEKKQMLSWEKGKTYPYKGRLMSYVYLMETVYVDWGCD